MPASLNWCSPPPRHGCLAAAPAFPAPPTPWLLVLMLASLVTLGHVTAALAMILFVAAPLSALSFWALAGVFTRSDVVRVLGGLLWASTGIMFGWYAQANMPMLTVMVFLPAAFAFVFRAVGMYHTEDPLKPRTSVQAAAIAALCFIPVVAAEPQLLFALIVVFLMFLLFVRRKRRHAVAYSGSCRLCGGPYARQCGALRRFGHVASTVRRHHGANVIRQRVAGVAEPA